MDRHYDMSPLSNWQTCRSSALRPISNTASISYTQSGCFKHSCSVTCVLGLQVMGCVTGWDHSQPQNTFCYAQCLTDVTPLVELDKDLLIYLWLRLFVYCSFL